MTHALRTFNCTLVCRPYKNQRPIRIAFDTLLFFEYVPVRASKLYWITYVPYTYDMFEHFFNKY